VRTANGVAVPDDEQIGADERKVKMTTDSKDFGDACKLIVERFEGRAHALVMGAAVEARLVEATAYRLALRPGGDREVQIELVRAMARAVWTLSQPSRPSRPWPNCGELTSRKYCEECNHRVGSWHVEAAVAGK
jgi:hypothetical protein